MTNQKDLPVDFHRVPKFLIKKYDPITAVVFGVILNFSTLNKGYCYLNKTQLAEECGVGITCVKTHVKKLLDAELIIQLNTFTSSYSKIAREYGINYVMLERMEKEYNSSLNDEIESNSSLNGANSSLGVHHKELKKEPQKEPQKELVTFSCKTIKDNTKTKTKAPVIIARVKTLWEYKINMKQKRWKDIIGEIIEQDKNGISYESLLDYLADTGFDFKFLTLDTLKESYEQMNVKVENWSDDFAPIVTPEMTEQVYALPPANIGRKKILF